MHRIRGEILLKLNPANTATAEDAFLTAIAVARQQKAKSFELRAALSLAKIYQITSRAADFQTVLVPALQGFSQTPEFPEIEQAQRLLDALHCRRGVNGEKSMKAHIVGGGFGGLAAAALLIQNAKVPGTDITIYEADEPLGGGFFLDGSAETGYNLPGSVFDKEFRCTFELLKCDPVRERSVYLRHRGILRLQYG